MIWLIAMSVFIISFTLFNELIQFMYFREARVLSRLIKSEPTTGRIKEKSKFKKQMKRLSKWLGTKTSEQKLTHMQEKLDRSGLAKRFTVMEWQLLKQLICITSFILSLLFGWFMELKFLQNVMLGFFTYGLGLFAFRWVMLSKATKRKKEMQLHLPFALDLITISVQAGLSFDGAVLKVIENQPQTYGLTGEFEKFLKEVRMGVVRKTALKNLINRADLDDLRTVLQAVLQADELGSSLSNVLKIQSDIMRQKRKMQAREKALQAPVKMLFPLIFFIFPAIFVVILGPAVLQIMEMLK